MLNFRRRVPCRFKPGAASSLSTSGKSFCTSTSSCFLFSLVVDSDADVDAAVVVVAVVSFSKSPHRQ